MVLGGTVRSGRVLGAWPGLAPDQLVDGRDLAVATDSTLFSEVLVHHLGNPTSRRCSWLRVGRRTASRRNRLTVVRVGASDSSAIYPVRGWRLST